MRRFTEGGGGMATARIEEDTTGDDESVSARVFSAVRHDSRQSATVYDQRRSP